MIDGDALGSRGVHGRRTHATRVPLRTGLPVCSTQGICGREHSTFEGRVCELRQVVVPARESVAIDLMYSASFLTTHRHLRANSALRGNARRSTLGRTYRVHCRAAALSTLPRPPQALAS